MVSRIKNDHIDSAIFDILPWSKNIQIRLIRLWTWTGDKAAPPSTTRRSKTTISLVCAFLLFQPDSLYFLGSVEWKNSESTKNQINNYIDLSRPTECLNYALCFFFFFLFLLFYCQPNFLINSSMTIKFMLMTFFLLFWVQKSFWFYISGIICWIIWIILFWFGPMVRVGRTFGGLSKTLSEWYSMKNKTNS